MHRVLFLLSLIFLISACASKRYTKKADKFENAGLYSDAAEYYYEAVKRKDSNVEAKLGLRKNGQMTLDSKLSDFSDYYKQSNYKQSVYSYLEAESYYLKIKEVGVELSFPELNKTYYNEAKSEYLSQRYIDGSEKLKLEDFEAALAIFTEIKNIDENYKDTRQKYTTARYEPKYRQAIDMLDNGTYRKSYYTFSYIIDGTGEYKQSAALMNEALEKGTITILVTDLKYNSGKYRETASTITSNIRERLLNLDNPFVEIIDPSSVNASVYSRGKVNLQAANLAGIEAVFSGKLIEYSIVEGNLKKTPNKAYLKKVVKIKNEAGEDVDHTTYHKTDYMEYQAKNTASLKISFQMISTENANVITNGNFDKSTSDEIHYAIFEGDYKKLVPGTWKEKRGKSPEDVIKDNKSDIRKLQRLFRADKIITPCSLLLDKLVNQSLQKISQTVNDYNPEEE